MDYFSINLDICLKVLYVFCWKVIGAQPRKILMKKILKKSLFLFLTSSLLAGCGGDDVKKNEGANFVSFEENNLPKGLSEAEKDIISTISSGDTKKLIKDISEGKVELRKEVLKYYLEKKIFKTPDDFIKSLIGVYSEKSDYEKIVIVNSLFSDDLGTAANVRKSNHISDKVISNIKDKMLYDCGRLCDKYPLSSAVIFGMIGDQAILEGRYKTAYVAYSKEAIYSANSKTPLANDIYSLLDYFGCHEDRDGWGQLVNEKDISLDGLKGKKYRPIKDYDYIKVTRNRIERDPSVNNNIAETVSVDETLQYNCPLSQNFIK